MKVSVIVPMYNVKDYVAECLDSLAAQTLKDMEVLMVDDGCTDETPAIAAVYAAREPEKFRLLHKQNGGLSDARNYAVPYAAGEYISFLDSDDFVEPTLYEKLSACMDAGNDVAVTDIEYWYQDPSKRFVMKGLSDWPAATIQKKAMLSPMFAWNKMYRASWFQKEGYAYPVGTWYEDTPVTTRIFAHSRAIGYVPECLMHYRQREGSIMASFADPRIRQIFDIMAMVRDIFEQDGLAEQYHEELEYLHVEHLRLYGMFRFIRSPYWKELYEESERVMSTCYPRWKENPYLSNLNFKNRLFLRFYGSGTAWLFNRAVR